MAERMVRILDGNTFVVSDERGDIEASATDPTGLFSFDTRFLSRWVLTIDGQRLNSLSTDDIQYFETRFFLVPGTGTVYVDAKLSVIRQRAVGDGFHEELTIINHDDKPVDLAVRLDAASDFADLFEIKDALAKLGEYSSEISDAQLHLGYQRDTFRRETVISATAPAKVDRDGLSFDVRIEPHGTWSTDLSVVTAKAGAGGTHESTKYGRGRKQARPNMERGLEDVDRRCPASRVRLGAAEADLSAQPDRSRGTPILASRRRRQEPARRRPAVVHDHVRSRQHPHQPADAPVHARARGGDPAGPRGVAGQPSRRLPR